MQLKKYFTFQIPKIDPEKSSEGPGQDDFNQADQQKGNSGKSGYGKDGAFKIGVLKFKGLEEQDKKKYPNGHTKSQLETESQVGDKWIGPIHEVKHGISTMEYPLN